MESALLVAHGQPSDPGPAAAELLTLRDRVAALLPDWDLGTATLAEPGAVARATRGRRPGLVFPLFMASGWFTQIAVPRAVEAAGTPGWRMLTPFGALRAVQDLTVALAADAICTTGQLLLAAHGSFKSAAPAELANSLAARIEQETGAERIEVAFIEQYPQLAAVRGFRPGTPCLPFFAMAGGHVRLDLPRELARAGFQGPILPPVGLAPQVPGLIAEALRSAPYCI